MTDPVDNAIRLMTDRALYGASFQGEDGTRIDPRLVSSVDEVRPSPHDTRAAMQLYEAGAAFAVSNPNAHFKPSGIVEATAAMEKVSEGFRVLESTARMTTKQLIEAWAPRLPVTPLGDVYGIPVFGSDMVPRGQTVTIKNFLTNRDEVYVHRHLSRTVRYRRPHGRSRRFGRRPIVETRWISPELDTLLAQRRCHPKFATYCRECGYIRGES